MGLRQRFQTIRQVSEDLVRDLEPEDLMLQGMADASPAKWHLAHTTWFFEQFLLQNDGQHQAAPTQWHNLFNSYYRTIGSPHPRHQRGMLSRPALRHILAWRQRVNMSMERLLKQLGTDAGLDPSSEQHQLLATAELGLNHERELWIRAHSRLGKIPVVLTLLGLSSSLQCTTKPSNFPLWEEKVIFLAFWGVLLISRKGVPTEMLPPNPGVLIHDWR